MSENQPMCKPDEHEWLIDYERSGRHEVEVYAICVICNGWKDEKGIEKRLNRKQENTLDLVVQP